AVERNTHAIEHEDDAGRRVAHALHRRLVRQKIAAVSRFLEVNLRAVPFALRVDRGVDATLGAHRVRSLDWHEREKKDGDVRFAELDHRHEAPEPAADDDDAANGARRRSNDVLGGHYRLPRLVFTDDGSTTEQRSR